MLARLITTFLLSLSLATIHVNGQAGVELDCPDTDLTTYLLTLIDTLYASGLTTFEQLIAQVSDSDSGYDLLEGWYTGGTMTLLVPTDQAFQKANLLPPFDKVSASSLTDLLALHTLEGDLQFGTLPQAPTHGIGSTRMSMRTHMNSTTASDANQVMVMQRGDNGAVTLRLPTGNATSWGWEIPTANTVIANIIIMPIDTVVPFPPKLSTALTIPSTSRSTGGVPVLTKQFDQAGGAQQLEVLTPHGFTIFAPVDDAWTEDVLKAMRPTDIAVKILGNHYTTNYTLYSNAWTGSGKFGGLKVASEAVLNVETGPNGAYVSLGGEKAMILRSDITLENGVMHIIDSVLADPKMITAGAAVSVSPSAPSKTAGPSASGGANGTSGQDNQSAGVLGIHWSWSAMVLSLVATGTIGGLA